MTGTLPDLAAEEVDATVPVFEAVYGRHHVLYRYDGVESVEDGRRFLEDGEEYGELASVGVFVDGEPALVRERPGDELHLPDARERAWALRLYARARRG